MRRSRHLRVGPLVLGLVVLATSVVGCTQDPPASALKTETFTLGPFSLGPAGSETYRAAGFRGMDHPDGAIAIKAVRWHVLDGEGRELPSTDHRLHFHHVVAYSDREVDTACGYGSERWAAPGSERTDLELPNGYAYFTDTDDSWYANYDVMNLSDQPMTNVRVRYDVVYTTDRSTLRDVTPYWLDLAGCAGSGEISVPGGGAPGSVWTDTDTFRIRYPGVIVAVRGHMHDRGIDITLTGRSEQTICKATAVYDDGSDGAPPPPTGDDHGMDHGGDDHGTDHGGGGHSDTGPRITAIPLCKDLSYPVSANEQVAVTVRYHDEEALPDAMGKMLVYVADTRPPATTTTRRPTTSRPPTSRPAPPTTSPLTAD
jgi:hypothetical protein